MADIIPNQTSSADTNGDLTIRPMTGALGAEVRGVDLGLALTESAVTAVKEALLDHLVLYFPDQDLEPDHLITLAHYFGDLETERFIPPLDGHPGVHILKGISKSRLTTQNLIWHVDHSYKLQPSLGGALYAVDVPESGRDTLFASMYAAYHALSDRMRRYVGEVSLPVPDVVAYGFAFADCLKPSIPVRTVVRLRTLHLSTLRFVPIPGRAGKMAVRSTRLGPPRLRILISARQSVNPDIPIRTRDTP